MPIGVSRQEQLAEYRRALKGTASRARPRALLMERTFALADLLTSWRRDKRYVARDGSPRVLPINDRGATLQTLAKKFAPTMSVTEVVSAITRHGEATALRDDKIALVGGSVFWHRRRPR